MNIYCPNGIPYETYLASYTKLAMFWADATPSQGRRIGADVSSHQYRCRWPIQADGGQFRRRCGAKVDGKRSAVSGSPVQLASPIRLVSINVCHQSSWTPPAAIAGERCSGGDFLQSRQRKGPIWGKSLPRLHLEASLWPIYCNRGVLGG